MGPHPLRRYFRHGFLPQLIAFEACVRLGSVTRAAEELSLAQPTVSCLLRKLSDAVGEPVTVVRDRRVRATPAGESLLLLYAEMGEAFARFEARAVTPRRAGARHDPLVPGTLVQCPPPPGAP
jgi:DNA-binding transcriptional LysR family regulator